MPETRSGVIGGVDTHSRTHHAVALDDRGERLGDAEFPATARGYRELHQWLEAFGTIAAIAVEGTSSYGAGLTRWLLAQGLDVREVNQPHRHTRRRQGKSDPIDAEAGAGGYGAGAAQGHERRRRVDPHPRKCSFSCGQGPQCGAAAAARPEHRARGRADPCGSGPAPRVLTGGGAGARGATLAPPALSDTASAARLAVVGAAAAGVDPLRAVARQRARRGGRQNQPAEPARPQRRAVVAIRDVPPLRPARCDMQTGDVQAAVRVLVERPIVAETSPSCSL